MDVVFSARADLWPIYRPHLEAAFAERGLTVRLTTEPLATAEHVIYAPSGGAEVDFEAFPKLRAVHSLWAGVETIADNPSLAAPLIRMIDPGLTEGMREWVVGHCLRHHLGLDVHIRHQDGIWRAGTPGTVPPLARDRPITVLGLGVLGTAAATALAGLGFPVTGWSQRPRSIPGVECLAGPDQLDSALRGAEILVLLLPLTAETNGLLDARRLATLPDGAVILNPGRGALVDDGALLEALPRLGHATLDVFRVEPLPPDHPYWTHPKVTVTPHIASETRPPTASRAVAANIARIAQGLPPVGLVDRAAGY